MESLESKMKSADRVFVLSVMEGKKAINSTGTADPRLFNGTNKLHCIMDTQTNLWYFKYDMGGLPEPLKCRFTSCTAAKKYADSYYNPRNIEINQVIS